MKKGRGIENKYDGVGGGRAVKAKCYLSNQLDTPPPMIISDQSIVTSIVGPQIIVLFILRADLIRS